MNLVDQAAETPQSDVSLPAPQVGRCAAPQSWMVRLADAKYHWYDLITGIQERPDIRDPIGRYLRRMQFDLEAAGEKRHLFFAVTRPRVRFDVNGAINWGFFSLKLTLPLLMGPEERKENITIELKVPFAATMKKPTVTLTENFISLNWGGTVEVFSIHDLLLTYDHSLKLPSKVMYVGQTRDSEGRLARGRLPALRRLRALFGLEYDTLLLIQRAEVEVSCADGDPADLPANEPAEVQDILRAEQIDAVEAALIRYFESPATRMRRAPELQARSERLTAIQALNQLSQYTIDLEPQDVGSYACLASDTVKPAPRHMLSCYIADGAAHVAAMPIPEPEKRAKA